MLKIKDSTGKVTFILKDEDSAPVLTEELKTSKKKKVKKEKEDASRQTTDVE